MRTIVEYIRDELEDAGDLGMSRRQGLLGEFLAETICEHLADTMDIDPTDEEYSKLVKCLQDYLDDYYYDAQRLVEEDIQNANDMYDVEMEAIRG